MVNSALVTADFRDGSLPLLTLMQGLAAGENIEHYGNSVYCFQKSKGVREKMSCTLMNES